MGDEPLRALVADLRTQLAHARELDESTRQALHALAQELEGVLDAPAASAPRPPRTLRARAADRLRQLEVSHPRLSTTLGNIIDTLALYGL
jgi:hypothetical protein